MNKWIETDSNGDLVGIYEADTAPATAIEIDVPSGYPTHAKWDAQSQSFIDDFTVIETELLMKIDTEAGEFRTRFITGIPGQETTYRLKEDEAIAWHDGVSDPADFPYLREEAAAKGISIGVLASEVLATATLWRALNPKIEAARTAAKNATLAATSITAKQTAASVDWDALL